MARKKSPTDDPKFDAFLQKQFAELKRELAKYPAPGAAKQGKILQLAQAPQARAGRGSWRYGIAAAVLVAVAVPMVIQLNQQKAELVSKTEAPAVAPEAERTPPKPAEKQTAPKAELDSLDARKSTADLDEAGEKPQGYLKNAHPKAKKKGSPARIDDAVAGEHAASTLKASREEATPKDGTATGKAERKIQAGEEINTNAVRDNESEKFFAKKEENKSTLAQNSRAPRADNTPSGGAPTAPAAAPAPRPAITRSAAPPAEVSGAERGAMADKPAQTESNARSIAIDDAKTRIKKLDASEEEKSEMEKLWKEFEKDPKSFNKDKQRSARLRTLLSRHNEKSRAKRMRSMESQVTH